MKPDPEYLEGSFFCGLCGETYGASSNRVECPVCHRLICESCFESVKWVDLDNCPYCDSPLIMTKDVSWISWKNRGKSFFQEANWEMAAYCFYQVLQINPKDQEAKKLYLKADFLHRSYYY